MARKFRLADSYALSKPFIKPAVAAALFAFAACGKNDVETNQSLPRGTTAGTQIAAADLPVMGYPVREEDRLEQSLQADVLVRRWLDFRQIDRIAYEERFQFPNFRRGKSDEYTEVRTQPPLDILIVVDDSGSMEEEQTNLSTKLGPLLSFLTGADWRIHVITTSTTCGTNGSSGAPTYPVTINKADPNFAAKFTQAIAAGIDGDSTERGIKMAREALEKPCNNVMWLRPDSILAILMLSDEENCGYQGACASEGGWDTADWLYNYLGLIRLPGSTARLYGIIGDDPTPNHACRTTTPLNRYFEVIQRTGGICGDIAQTDYTAILRRISEDAATLLPPSIQLSEIPVTGSVVVTVDGNILPPTAYRIQNQNIYLLQALQTGQRVIVTYEYDAPYSKDFRLNNPAYPDSIQVLTMGGNLPSTGFAYTPQNTTLSILAAVNPNQLLIVKYRENKPLVDTFYVGQVSDPSSIHCYLSDGTELLNLSYDATRRAVIFSVPPPELAMFKCTLAR